MRSVRIPTSDNLPDRLGPFDADELLVQAAVEVGQAVGIEAELGEHRGTERGRAQRLPGR